jgi:site-specific DNA recombinase
MSRQKNTKPTTTTPTIRCAIYTRKSSEEGLDQEFNSLDAQRESAEAYIASQKAEGWVALPDQYNDGGFSGGSIERPALERLLRDIDNGKIDCVVVYKVDRLSRSLMDFSRIMETFEKHNVSFVSVTQHFNTTHSMGRLTLNILLSFAQFEREIIGERIRDKLSAQARRGKWTGGIPILGYDVDRSGGSPKLVINAKEAARVREIFRMYLEKGSLLPVVIECSQKTWVNKRRVTKKGKKLGGRPFDKATLYMLLTNPMLTGKIKHNGELYEGEHEAIIDQETFDQVQHQLSLNGRTGGAEVRNKYGAILKGLLRCKCCQAAMCHTFSGKSKKAFHRYYRCSRAIKSGRQACTVGTLPAAEIERVVVDEVRRLGTDKALLAEVLKDAHVAIDTELAELRREHDELVREAKRHHAELRQLIEAGNTSAEAMNRIAGLNQQTAEADRRLPVLEQAIAELEAESVSQAEAQKVFGDFDGLWDSLIPREQARLLKLMLTVVEYDGDAGTVAVTFRTTSIRTLITQRLEEAA